MPHEGDDTWGYILRNALCFQNEVELTFRRLAGFFTLCDRFTFHVSTVLYLEIASSSVVLAPARMAVICEHCPVVSPITTFLLENGDYWKGDRLFGPSERTQGVARLVYLSN
jgi:hypothetical protein